MWVKHVKCEKYVLFNHVNISFENVHCDRFYYKTLVDMPISLWQFHCGEVQGQRDNRLNITVVAIL